MNDASSPYDKSLSSRVIAVVYYRLKLISHIVVIAISFHRYALADDFQFQSSIFNKEKTNRDVIIIYHSFGISFTFHFVLLIISRSFVGPVSPCVE